MRNYSSNYGETLYEAINSEWGLDKATKQRVLKYLNNCIISSEAWNDNKPNCKIDKSFSQGQTGDCWFLASIAAAQRSPKGQQILNNTIKDNKDGTYTVKFKGADKEYTVSALEIASKYNLAGGDKDIRIVEIAASKHYNITGINGGNPAAALDLLLGTNDFWKNLGRAFSPKLNLKDVKKLLNNKNVIMTACIDPVSKLYGLIVRAIPEDADYKKEIAMSHAYAVVNIDDKNIYLKNPWNTEKDIAIPLDVFEDYWGAVQYTEIK